MTYNALDWVRSRSTTMLTSDEHQYLERAIALALAAEQEGNLPIGAVLTLDGRVLGEGANHMASPVYEPGRHAEIEALRSVPPEAWARAQEMTCYSTLEPCVMCTGTLLLHGIGRVVFGANDVGGGGGVLLPHLPAFFDDGERIPEWIGPVSPARCDPLAARARALFATLPCGQNSKG